MKRLLPFAALSLALLAALFGVLNRRSAPGGDGAGAPGYVIGEEMARASEAERRRRDAGPSPMPASEYGEREAGLYDPARLPLDDTLAALARRFAAGDAAARNRMRRAVSSDEFYILLGFARRSSVFAMRERSAAHARDALAAVAMVEEERVDPRDVLGTLSLVHHGASRAGADADALFRQAAALAEPGTAALIRGFAARAAAEKVLRDHWGYVEVRAPGGPGFLQWEFAPYAPTRDLAGAALGVAALLEADRYATNVVLATDLPPVWLSTAGSPSVARQLEAVRAGATINAFVPTRADAPEKYQMLMVFLVEAASEADARALLDASRRVRAGDRAVLGAARGPLFCLLVSSSMVEGEKPAETTESLARFADGLAQVLARHAGPS